jgi:hypothetical protein
LRQPLAQYPSFAPLLGAIPKLCTSHWRNIWAWRHYEVQYPSFTPAIGHDTQALRQPLSMIFKHRTAIRHNTQALHQPLSAIFKHRATIGHDTQASHQPLAWYSSIALLSGAIPNFAPTIEGNIQASGHYWVQYPSFAPVIGVIFKHCAAIRRNSHALHQPLSTIFKHHAAIGRNTHAARRMLLGALSKHLAS